MKNLLIADEENADLSDKSDKAEEPQSSVFELPQQEDEQRTKQKKVDVQVPSDVHALKI